MTEFVEQLVAGVAAGGIYASLALALVIIYRAMGLINFAQGEFAMFADAQRGANTPAPTASIADLGSPKL